ncbi:MAG: ATP-binding protein [Bacillota bacterium]
MRCLVFSIVLYTGILLHTYVTAILDRLLHKCEVIKMDEDSQRLKYLKTIFGNN